MICKLCGLKRQAGNYYLFSKNRRTYCKACFKYKYYKTDGSTEAEFIAKRKDNPDYYISFKAEKIRARKVKTPEYHRARHWRYRQTDKGREAVRRATQKYAKAHPDRVEAYWKVQVANLPKKPCEVCGKLPTHKHHPDYSKPLEVVYLCPLHHRHLHMSKPLVTERKLG